MRISLPPLEIGDKEGFTPEKDIFNRSEIGKGLSNLVTSADQPLVIAVDALWGSGKTTFLKMWAGELRKMGVPVVYFDAFQNDYVEDAFTAIAGQLISLVRDLRKDKTGLARSFATKAIGAGKVILRSGLRIGVKAGTLGALEAADLQEVGKDIAKEISEIEDKYLGEAITKQREQQSALDEFREALSELPQLLSEDPKKPLIFVIDELDRCKPIFALQVLERIKHFFTAPRVHFVLGTHSEQLKNSVVAAYGSGIDAHTYLQKFIHLTLHLIDDSAYRQERVVAKYIQYLGRQYEIDLNEHDLPLMRHVCERHGLTLRTIDRIMMLLSIAHVFRSKQQFCPIEILEGLLILRVTKPELYVKARTKSLVFEDVRNPLGFSIGPLHKEDGPSLAHYSEVWRYCLDPNLQAGDELFARMEGLGRSHRIKRENLIQYVANGVVDRLTPFELSK